MEVLIALGVVVEVRESDVEAVRKWEGWRGCGEREMDRVAVRGLGRQPIIHVYDHPVTETKS